MYLETLKMIFSWKSIFDIVLVAVFFYKIIAMLKGTRAAQVLIGMLVIFVAYVFSNALQLETLHWIISKFYSSFIIVVIVLFQDDIRRLLSQFGKGPFFSGIEASSGSIVIDEIIGASKALSHERIGALIVFERSIGLDKLYDHSIKLDALVSEQLLGSIFQSFSPLHDGAVIIQKNRITCASAQLPLSKNPRFSKKMGTRHSAAVGISEETDSVVVVVSEETGNISIAWEGNLQKQASAEAAKKMLHVLLLPRGERNSLIIFLEDKIFFKYNKFVLSLRSKAKSQKNQKNHSPNESERRKSIDRRHGASLSSLDTLSLKQVERENKMASNSPRNIHIRFPKNSKIKEMTSFEHQFVLSTSHKDPFPVAKSIEERATLLEASLLAADPFNINDDAVQTENALDKNEALKALSALAPEDRFDPPIPKSPPPRDVSIGGIPLDLPVEKKITKDEDVQ